jgi:hypothetical protein
MIFIRNKLFPILQQENSRYNINILLTFIMTIFRLAFSFNDMDNAHDKELYTIQVKGYSK